MTRMSQQFQHTPPATSNLNHEITSEIVVDVAVEEEGVFLFSPTIPPAPPSTCSREASATAAELLVIWTLESPVPGRVVFTCADGAVGTGISAGTVVVAFAVAFAVGAGVGCGASSKFRRKATSKPSLSVNDMSLLLFFEAREASFAGCGGGVGTGREAGGKGDGQRMVLLCIFETFRLVKIILCRNAYNCSLTPLK